MTFNNNNSTIISQGSGNVEMHGGQTFSKTNILKLVFKDYKGDVIAALESVQKKIGGEIVTRTPSSDSKKYGRTASEPSGSLVTFGYDSSYFWSIDLKNASLLQSVNLPQGVEDRLPGRKKGNTRVRWLSLGPNKSYFMTYEAEDGEIRCIYHTEDKNLIEWIQREPTQYQDMRVVFGPGPTYYAVEPNKGRRWKGIPEKLEIEIKERGRPSVVALGVNGAYIAAWKNGDCSYDDANDYYPFLDWFVNKRRTIECAAMSPSSEDYYIQFTNGEVAFFMPNFGTKEATSKLDAIPNAYKSIRTV